MSQMTDFFFRDGNDGIQHFKIERQADDQLRLLGSPREFNRLAALPLRRLTVLPCSFGHIVEYYSEHQLDHGLLLQQCLPPEVLHTYACFICLHTLQYGYEGQTLQRRSGRRRRRRQRNDDSDGGLGTQRQHTLMMSIRLATCCSSCSHQEVHDRTSDVH